MGMSRMEDRPLSTQPLSEAWADAWGTKRSGRRSSQSQYVQPRQQIRRDFEEAKRVASMFEHLENLDESLSWGGLLTAATQAARPRRILKTFVLLLPFILFTASSRKNWHPWALHRFSFYEQMRTLLTHASAASLSYLILGFAFQVLTTVALRASRGVGWRRAEKIIYLNGILFSEERAAIAIICAWSVNFSWWSPPQDTRLLLAKPCVCTLLLLLCNGLKKILEFSFLRSKLALNFESDVLVNAFERATLERVADFACLEDPPSELLHLLQQTTVLPALKDPHAFEKLTAEHLRKAYSPGQVRRPVRVSSGSVHGWPISLGRGADLFRSLQHSSTTTFFMRMDGKYDDIDASAKRAYAKLSRPTSDMELGMSRSPSLPDEWDVTHSQSLPGASESGQEESHAEVESVKQLSFMDIRAIMPEEEAAMTWQMLSNRSSPCIGEGDFVSTTRGAFERFHMIAATVKDYAAIWLVFSNVVNAVQILISVVIILGTFFPPEVLRAVCLSMSTVALGLSFIFGNLLRETFESVVLLLVMHPYDVGDRILLQDTIYTIQKINILTTEARDLSNHCVYLKNSKLFHEDTLLNLGRSLNAVVEINIVFQTSEVSMDILSRINAYVDQYVSSEKEAWVPSYVRSFCAVNHGRATCDLAGVTTHCIRLMHRLPWQSIPEIRKDTTRVMYKLLGEIRSWGVDFRQTPLPVHLESRLPQAESDQPDALRMRSTSGLTRGVSPDCRTALFPASWNRKATDWQQGVEGFDAA
ncbi:unnamed protein product [Effrenium voratum]|uniref:Mechanosensitive ion channel MscS domain-containing protein n=1 Tax=Effrenium voratum TaxID=2562239 RepID=A0AA36IVZ8_9DINO|nr:unnamed protein product [Effrenium voratum]CAJ1435056.1 unnamed protein product [Effrenium voratum]